jgi:streptomycin 6-kinase
VAPDRPAGIDLPQRFAEVVRDLFGADGDAWLARLPAVLDGCARRWGLHVGEVTAPSFGVVAYATGADGTPYVLKLCPPQSGELAPAAAALGAYRGRGSVRLLDADLDRGALLLERLLPGSGCAELVAADDEAATSAIIAVAGQLHRAELPSHPFETVERWGIGFHRHRAAHGGGTGPIPAGIFAAAEAIFAELVASQAPAVLLHGDLHHDNVLAAEREPWLAIDPKGVLGEPAYEYGAMLRNPWPELLDLPDPALVLRRRLDQLDEALPFDRDRLRDWAFAQAVLAEVWCVEDHGEPSGFVLRCAELLRTA